MKELISWTNSSLYNGKSPLIVSALLRYRFVTIHPFMDGNGRLARLLSNYVLLANNYSVLHYSAIEKQHEKNRVQYYTALRRLQAPVFYDIPDNINLTSWICYWAGCLKKTYKEAISRMERHKILKALEYGSIMGIGRTQAVSDLKKLVETGYLKKVGGDRSTTYQIITR